MPQGRAELHERFGDDCTAFAVLEKLGWTHNRGVMKAPPELEERPWIEWSPDEKDAVEYLVTEWDWA